jgi:CheY-like chemotaxis protein
VAGNKRGVREIKNSSRGGQAAEGNRLLYQILVYSGLCHSTCSNWRRRHKGYKEHAADVVLLEIDLSEMEGIDVVRAIRENPVRAETPSIAISAFPYMRVMCLDNGSNGFIQKPIKALDLLTQLRKLTKG